MRSSIIVLGSLVVIVLGSAQLAASEIHDAIRRGDLPAVQRLVASDSSLLGAKEPDGSTPLHVAARTGNIEIAKYLLGAGADLRAGDNENSNVLHLAAVGGRRDMIDLVLARGIDVNSADDNGMTAILFAVGYNHADLVPYLVSKGARIDCKTKHGTTLMHQAAYRGNLDLIKYLVSEKQSLNPGFDQWGNTPLLASVSRGRKDAVAYLLDNGADPNATSQNGLSALAFAVLGGDPEIVRMLIAGGADVQCADEYGWTALHRSAQLLGNVDIAKLLVDAGAEVDLEDKQGITPLRTAAERGFTDLVKYLASRGAAIEASDDYFGCTALHVAATKGYDDLAEFLMGAGAALDARDTWGNTPLDCATKHGNAAIADAIRARGGRGAGKNEPASALLSKKLKEGEAIVWYTGHSGWAVQTKNNFLVFDYFQDGRAPDAPSILNGCINPTELAGKKVTVFVSHLHSDHYNRSILEWARQMDGVTYVFGQEPDTAFACEMIEPRQTKNIGGIEVTAALSTDAGVGFLVTVDGLTLMHSGDLHNRDANLDGVYAQEIGFFASKGRSVDLAFFPVSGCGFGDIEIVKKGVYFAADKLLPAAMFPMHGGNDCYRYFEFAKEAKKAGCTVPMGCATARGDRFLYRKGKLKAI
jgi:ankyrin repeat protein/L-ascorbate metabolism protein UlaG (beta-lactamase superfamily)